MKKIITIIAITLGAVIMFTCGRFSGANKVYSFTDIRHLMKNDKAQTWEQYAPLLLGSNFADTMKFTAVGPYMIGFYEQSFSNKSLVLASTTTNRFIILATDRNHNVQNGLYLFELKTGRIVSITDPKNRGEWEWLSLGNRTDMLVDTNLDGTWDLKKDRKDRR
ncbi:MAG: hypothetical protein PHR77_09390 [Kiritimatiellae bacterium]|nr:hypothetical protein [Kiritimatiellia bacterium]MDD5522951.1 hypothetical protein [Kiritimatiellia bacterium]